MAALTNDRIAEKKLRPAPIKTVRVVDDNAGTIFRNALVGVREDNGLVEPLSSTGTYTQILLATDNLEAGERGEFLQGVIVEVLTDFAADATINGNAVYGVDDQTCSDASADGVKIGTVYGVISADRVFVDTRNA